MLLSVEKSLLPISSPLFDLRLSPHKMVGSLLFPPQMNSISSSSSRIRCEISNVHARVYALGSSTVTQISRLPKLAFIILFNENQ